jgi:predicted HAD superfamily hydrolase
LHGLLQQAYRQVLESSSAAKEEAIKYFDQFQGKKIAIIDLGWLGSLQQNFTKLLALSNSSVKVDGYYFHLWQLPQYSRASLHDNFYAYLREHGNDLFADLPDLIQTGGVELLEDVLSGSHGTTLGYLDAEPVLEDKESTIDLSPLQDAAIAFFDNLLPILRMIPPQTLDSLDWTRPFFRMVEFPTMQEADVLGEIQHSDVAGMTEQSLVPLAGKLEEYMLSDKEVYKTAEKTSFWKQGFKLRNKAAYKKKK